MGIADRIKEARSEAGLSQVAFARTLDVDERSVRRWERGRTTPNANTVQRIARATGKAPAFFFASEDEPVSDRSSHGMHELVADALRFAAEHLLSTRPVAAGLESAYAGPDRRRTQIGPALLEQPGPGTTA